MIRRSCRSRAASHCCLNFIGRSVLNEFDIVQRGGAIVRSEIHTHIPATVGSAHAHRCVHHQLDPGPGATRKDLGSTLPRRSRRLRMFTANTRSRVSFVVSNRMSGVWVIKRSASPSIVRRVSSRSPWVSETRLTCSVGVRLLLLLSYILLVVAPCLFYFTSRSSVHEEL